MIFFTFVVKEMSLFAVQSFINNGARIHLLKKKKVPLIVSLFWHVRSARALRVLLISATAEVLT